MRVCLWHGWLLEGSGSNVYAAKTAEALRKAGHDVLLVCQEPHPDAFPFIDEWGTVGHEVSELVSTGVSPAAGGGRAVLLRPTIGDVLPVFVYDEYEGFEVKTFVDISDEELEAYLHRNVEALRTAVAWHRSDAVVAGHAVPGATIARRALGEGNYIAKVHGSDIEYALKRQPRLLELAREGLEGARLVAGASEDVLDRTIALVPSLAGRTLVVHPGVDVERFHRRDRRQALEKAAALVEADPDRSRGRSLGLTAEVETALKHRDAGSLDALARRYDQAVPDQDAPAALRLAATHSGPIVGYIGKLIPEKGVERLIEASALWLAEVRTLVVGFGTFREWLTALLAALDARDPEAVAWLRENSAMQLELSDGEVSAAASGRPSERSGFTGRLDHRYAPYALAAMDVLVVPSTLAESFGMVAAEGAAAGALPMVSRHSGLAEVAGALEAEVGRPGLFSFEPGDGATHRLAAGVRELLALPEEERAGLRKAVSAYVAREWSWKRTASKLLEASK